MTILVTTEGCFRITSSHPLKLLFVTKQTPSFTSLEREPSNKLLQALVSSLTSPPKVVSESLP